MLPSKDDLPQGKQRHLCFTEESQGIVSWSSPLLLSPLCFTPVSLQQSLVHGGSPISAPPPQDQDAWEMSSWDGFQMMDLDQGAGGFCRTLKGREQGFRRLCAECRGRRRTPLLLKCFSRKASSSSWVFKGYRFQGERNFVSQDLGQIPNRW